MQTKNVIGICLSWFYEDIQTQTINAICSKAKEYGYGVLIYSAYEDLSFGDSYDKGEKSVFELVDYDRLSGIIMLSETIKDKTIINHIVEEGKNRNIPVVSIEQKIDGCYYVQYENNIAFEDIVRHVVENHKCRRVNFLAGIKNNAFSDERIAIYKKVLAENNIEFDSNRLGYGDFWEIPAVEAVKKFIECETELPEAIICANDSMALAVCNYLSEQEIKVPQDVIVTGYDAIMADNLYSPKITTAVPDYDTLGRIFFEIVSKCKGGTDIKPFEITIPCKNIYSESCGCENIQADTVSYLASELYRKYDDQKSHVFHRISMIKKTTSEYNLGELLKMLENSVLEELECNFYYICAYDSYFKIENEVEDNQKEVTILSKYQNGIYTIPMNKISILERLPEYDALIASGYPILFLPLHLNDDVFGYIAIGYVPKVLDYAKVLDCGLDLNNIFGMAKRQHQLSYMNQKLEELYIRDSLTNLYNRRGFYQKLDSVLKKQNNGKLLGVLIDIDGMKYINDNYGHGEGDSAIKAVADILEANCNKTGICARFGGDEYAMAVFAGANEKECHKMLEQKLIAGFDEYNQKNAKKYKLRVSYGIVTADIEEGFDINELLKLADIKMYQQKSSSRHSIRTVT